MGQSVLIPATTRDNVGGAVMITDDWPYARFFVRRSHHRQKRHFTIKIRRGLPYSKALSMIIIIILLKKIKKTLDK